MNGDVTVLLLAALKIIWINLLHQATMPFSSRSLADSCPEDNAGLARG